MTWLDVVDNPEALRAFFPGGAPSLRLVRVHEILLHQDASRLVLRLDLNEYPAAPPQKWAAATYNTVQIQLMFIGARSVNIQGWSTNNVGDLVIAKLPDSTLEVTFTSESSRLCGVFQFVRIDKVSAYRSE